MTIAARFRPELLAGPDRRLGPEPWGAHLRRLGPLPRAEALLGILERSGLRGRGGAAFPVARKWRAVAAHGQGRSVVLVNGAEGDPLSHKDRLLLRVRPHLVLDGALLAAQAVGADRVLLYAGEEDQGGWPALRAALVERGLGPASRPAVHLLVAPKGYVAGEETAAVRFAGGGPALPATRPPRPFERGVGGRPTLVQNVETLAAVALLARSGDRPPTTLVTVSGAVAEPGVQEIPIGTTVGEVAGRAGGMREMPRAVLLGGYAGSFVPAGEAWGLALDPIALRGAGLRFGCGVVAFLPQHACGVGVTAEILSAMAAAGAGQCGPCRQGLAAIAATLRRLAAHRAEGGEVAQLQRWSAMVAGRGACSHPDGAAALLASALRTFADDFRAYEWQRDGARARQRRVA